MGSHNITTSNEQREGAELLEASTHAYNHLFSFIKSLAVKCAIQLGIPDAIKNHGKPMAISELSQALPIHPQKARFLPQLMRILTHLGYFSHQKLPTNTVEYHDDISYTLTDAGKLLLKDNPSSAIFIFLFILDSSFIKSWMDLSQWFQNEDETPFQTAHGMPLWEYTCHDEKLNNNINKAMACDSRLIACFLLKNKHLDGVLEGISSLVDVGGGFGGLSRAIADAFPNIKCSVLDLPHVIDGLKGTDNFTYIAGDMFVDIPPTDAVLLKWVLHDWIDEDVVKILKLCKKAVTSNKNGRRGKVIIIDVAMGDEDKEQLISRETQLFFDMEMMGILAGKERTMKEWKKIFEDAGFAGGHRIYPVVGFRSLIEVFP